MPFSRQIHTLNPTNKPRRQPCLRCLTAPTARPVPELVTQPRGDRPKYAQFARERLAGAALHALALPRQFYRGNGSALGA